MFIFPCCLYIVCAVLWSLVSHRFCLCSAVVARFTSLGMLLNVLSICRLYIVCAVLLWSLVSRRLGCCLMYCLFVVYILFVRGAVGVARFTSLLLGAWGGVGSGGLSNVGRCLIILPFCCLRADILPAGLHRPAFSAGGNRCGRG